MSYIAHIFCICIHICKRYYFPLLLFLRWKAKEKISYSFWITFATTYRCDLGAGIVKPFFCLNVFTQENRIISHSRPMSLSYRSSLFVLDDKLTDWGSACWWSWLQMLKLNSSAFFQGINISNVLLNLLKNNFNFDLLFQSLNDCFVYEILKSSGKFQNNFIETYESPRMAASISWPLLLFR